MDITQLRRYLDSPSEAQAWLLSWGVVNTTRAHQNMVRMATGNITLDLLGSLCDQLAELLPECPDADMALNNLERFLAASRSPLATISLFERDREALPILVQIFSTSQYFSDLLIADNESFELLRLTQGQPVSRDSLVQEISTEVLALSSTYGVNAALRRFKRRETLRIGYGDIVRGLRLEQTTAQISYLADAIVEAALRASRIMLEQKYGTPMRPDGTPARFVVLGLGKLGGNELNYSSDIDLVFLYDTDGMTTPPRKMTNHEFFARLAKELAKVLSEVTELGYAYRVDLRLRPEGNRGPIVMSLDSAMSYYDTMGRTWERQAFIKARPVAGSLEVGQEFLAWMEPWIYRKYLTLADITGIKALKRRIEQRTLTEGGDESDVKTGRGGIRDVEFVIQYLQLLNAADLPKLRTGNTLQAMASLEGAGCLTDQERAILEANYRFLRNIEHRLQFMFDLQTHRLPTEPLERRRLAIRLGYRDTAEQPALEAFAQDYEQAKALNRKILDHLLHDAFPDDPELDPEADLVLDPDPSSEKISQVLGRYPFRDVSEAYRHLMDLATEPSRYLYPRRCRLILASIAGRLLDAVATTPDPDHTLLSLAKISDSLGGKVVLWELFRFAPVTLDLCVNLCCYSPMLTEILVRNPGMIDELMDSLVLNKLPTFHELKSELTELCRGAEDIEPILHSFKNSHILTVGVRDILDKESLEATTGTLTDLAEVCLEEIIRREIQKLVSRFGEPRTENGDPCEFIVLAMGKFGGRELSYHSDLDLVFLYEAEGMTVPGGRGRRAQPTTNQHFFSELGQRIIKGASHLGPHGRLYEIDLRLRPTGKSGAVVTTLQGFQRYFQEGRGQLWERQALCKARVVYASEAVAAQTQELIDEIAFGHPWRPEDAESIRTMRLRLQETTTGEDLKRGAGGLVDIEFLTQMLQLQYGREQPQLRCTNTLQALSLLREAGHVSTEDYEQLVRNYRLLRRIETRLRLTNATARDVLPDAGLQREKLARQLGYPTSDDFLSECQNVTRDTRQLFEELFTASTGS